MNFLKGTLALSLSYLLVACGGGGSDGYYDNKVTDNIPPTTQSEETIKAQKTLDLLKTEGQYLFGNYDPNDSTTAKGYIDHALDTFSQGPLQLAIDAKKLFDKDKTAFYYREKCMDSGTYANTGCYILFGDNVIKNALNNINPQKYTSWDFDVNDNEIAGMKLSEDQINKFTGKTMIIIFDNRNTDKKYNDIWVTGVFGYPYKQSWGLTQTDQLRIVSMNEADSNYQVTLTYDDETTETKGALSIYKDPTSKDGELYVLQNNSSFDVLTNDNPNTPEVEPVSFTINSIPGDNSALATYRIKSNLTQVLNLPNVSAISGTRIENETPSANTQNFTGSIYLEGRNIFTFKQALNGSILKFKHALNGITFEGQSVNQNGKISTTLTQPNNIKY
ncbi:MULTISPECIES: hypothetical protein [Acinetobacter]|uniref:Lipoprotein n=1 Tax=Acinetobacter piscicola TaxID=2006115 RepID=A0A7S6VUD5_9GAMM|nr:MULTISPECIES: hypothetical protein [Acinetobacter]MDM1759214.1 hypothetical protein [Acinetobacter sp. 256-1]MDM1761806.1 hypothetical protein [Acinetobacter sp. 251-1]QOW44955.1 hypothetical protein G0028_03040 [Acinetobacter piscicola]